MQEMINGVLVDLPADEIAIIDVRKKEAEDNLPIELANEARDKRNALLVETDWTASSDVTMSDAMKAYRQALRDVPAQDGFPTDINWPTLGE
jgi:hypothetical protein